MGRGQLPQLLEGRPQLGPIRLHAPRPQRVDRSRSSRLSVLDVGCGGGLLAEEFARLGCRVTGVDPSAKSIEEARRHAATAGLAIDYRTGCAEQLPTDDCAYDVVYCCDVLEHVNDVGRSINEIARSLRPGGLFLYDTINRTWRSWILLIKMAQDWRLTRWAEPNLHEWKRFIRPRELDLHLRSARLQPVDRIGMSPRNPVTALRAFIDHARGRIDHAEMGRRLALTESRDTSSSYAGWA